MGYPAEMRALSALNGRLVTEKPKVSKRSELQKLIQTFYNRNSVHGINNFFGEFTGFYERCTWFLVLALTIMGMVYVSLILSQRYSDRKFQTVVDRTAYPVYEVVFPTITICNHNRLNWKRIEAAKAKFLPLEKDQKTLDLFAEFVAAFDGITFGKFSAFENVSEKPLKLLNKVNFTNVFDFMTWTCAEMLGDCKWRDEEFKCCDKFYQQKSELGLCFSFNGVQKDESNRKTQMDPFYPLHNANYGPQSGLEVKVFIRPEDHVPNSQLAKGIIAMVHEPPVWQSDRFFIPWKTETAMEIEPIIYFYDNNTRSVSSNLRECVFDMRALSALNGRLVTEKPKVSERSELRKLIHTFYNRNSIHGINNFIRESTGRYERCTWFLVLVLTVVGMVYVSLILSQRYSDRKFQTVVDRTANPIYKVVFPTITICNHNRLNWKRIEAAKAKFLPLEEDLKTLDLFAEFVAAFDGITFGKFSSFENVSEKPLKLLNEVNFTNVFAFMTWTCAEMLGDCKWRDEKFKCCDKFYQQKSELGLCFSFNGVQNDESKNKAQKDPFYPLHNANYGPQSGLEVKVFIRPEDHVPNSQLAKGIIAMVHEPPVWHKDGFFIPWNTETAMEIEPVIYFYGNNTRSVPSSLRQCVFDDERNSADFKSLPGYVYMIENCYSQCHQEHLMRYCNCTLDLFFPPGDFPTCRASDFQCIYQHRDYFRYTKQKGEEQYVFNQQEGMTCKCFRNCFSLNYITEVRPSYLPTNILGNLSYVDLDIHYRFDSIMVYRTGLVFGWVDLMVSFGGIAGLFLGCSLISAVEILYFLVVDTPRFIYQHLRQQRTTKKVANLHQPWARGGYRPNEHNLGIFHVGNVLGRHFK